MLNLLKRAPLFIAFDLLMTYSATRSRNEVESSLCLIPNSKNAPKNKVCTRRASTSSSGTRDPGRRRTLVAKRIT